MISRKFASEIAEYFKLPEESILKNYKNINNSPSKVLWVKKSIEDWDNAKVDQNTKKSVEDWFKKTDSYIFELMENHSIPAKKHLKNKIVDFCLKHQVKTLLDFGGGVGEDAIATSKKGIQTTLADLPGKTLDFAKWRIKKTGLKITTLAITGDGFLKTNYQAILCLEVFQHLFNPLKSARYLFSHLEKGGFLLVTTHFNNPFYKMALKKNTRFQESFDNELKKIGFCLFDKIYQWGKNENEKYLFIYQRK